jgi:hypothetical protein
MSSYEELIAGYLAAGSLALDVFNSNGVQGPGIQFLLPFGLCMANVRSVQLLHYPPTESFSYSDYLYSPTTIRWECLLVQNGLDGSEVVSLERIVDVVPIATDGGNSEGIDPYNNDFIPYAKAQMRNFLRASVGKRTAPVVAFGGPVRDWLWSAFKDQIARQLEVTGDSNPLRVLTVLELEVVEGTKTAVLCANHPSMYLYDTSLPVENAGKSADGKYASPLTVMRQDLVAAGWQCAMAKNWGGSAAANLGEMNERWKDDSEVKRIMKDQNAEFSFPRVPIKPGKPKPEARKEAQRESYKKRKAAGVGSSTELVGVGGGGGGAAKKARD